MRERTRPKSSSGQVSPAPSEYCCESLRPRSVRRLLAKPIRPIRLTRGKRSAVATPMSAVAAASWRSAATRSGRRRSSCSGVPIGSADRSVTGRVGSSCGVASCAGDDARRLRRQRREAVGGAVDRRLQRRQRRLGAVELALRARDVEPRAAAGVEPGASVRRSVSRWLTSDSLRHLEALLQAAQLEVVARHLGGDGGLRRVHAGLGGVDLRRRRFAARGGCGRRSRAPSWR